MSVISARDVLNTPRDAVWGLNQPVYQVKFDDGVTAAVKRNHLVLDRYFWELFLLFPSTPITHACDVGFLLKGESYDADTHKQMLERVYRHIVRYNQLETFAAKEGLLKRVYEIIDMIHNEIVENISTHVATLDAVDFNKVINDPAIVAAHENMRPTPEGVDRVYKQIKSYIQTAPLSNRFVAAYRNKSANENQANQLIGPRGFISGRDLTVYLQPVQSGFIRGMSTLYEVLVESLTAAKSLAANETNIKKSEYTSRRIQLLAMSVKGVVVGDCGSTEYMPILVTQGMLDSLKGKYYLKSDNTIGVIEGDEAHLVDKSVQFRTSLGCKHHDSAYICSTCLGKMAHNFPINSNLGYMMAAYLMEKITQAILSTKHLTHSVKKSLIQLFGIAVKYFHANEDGDLFFHQDIDLKGLQIVLPNSKLSKLVDVLNLSHTNINFNKIGELDEVVIRDTKQKTPTMERLHLAYKDRNCIITKQFLEYMKQVKLETDSRTNFIIPLDGWDKSQPILNSPLKEANILNFVNQISNIIEKKGGKIVDPYEKLHRLFTLVLEKFKINLSVVEVLIYATTTYNAPGGNYKLGRNSQYPYSEEDLTLFTNRDFAGFAAYERQMKPLIENPMTVFGEQPRQPHPMALYFTPQDLAPKT
jgi:hypothetical protein